MCNACKLLSKVFDPVQNIIVSRVNNHNTGNPMFIVASGEGAVNFEAQYCPWCGERLRGEKEEDEA